MGTGRNYEEAVMGLRGWDRVRCKVHFQAFSSNDGDQHSGPSTRVGEGGGEGGRGRNKPTKCTRGRRSNPARPRNLPRNRGPILNYHPKKGRKPINEPWKLQRKHIAGFHTAKPFLPSRLLDYWALATACPAYFPTFPLPCLAPHPLVIFLV